MTVPFVTPAASKTAVTGTPYFLKISYILSRNGMALSLSSICVCSLASSSVLSATLPSEASLSEGEVYSSLIIALFPSFCRLSSASCSFISSRVFVELSLSSRVFLFLTSAPKLSVSRLTSGLFVSQEPPPLFFIFFLYLFDSYFLVASVVKVLIHFQHLIQVVLFWSDFALFWSVLFGGLLLILKLSFQTFLFLFQILDSLFFFI